MTIDNVYMTTKHALLTLLGAGLLSALSSCTSPVSPAGTGLPGVTNYYTNFNTNRNPAMVRLVIQHNTVVPIRIQLVDTPPFVSGNTNFTYWYTSTLENSNTQYFSVQPGMYFLTLYFPSDPLSTNYAPIYHGVYRSIGWYGSGVTPFELTGGGHYTFVINVKTTNPTNNGLGWSNMLMSYQTRPVNLPALNTIVLNYNDDGY